MARAMVLGWAILCLAVLVNAQGDTASRPVAAPSVVIFGLRTLPADSAYLDSVASQVINAPLLASDSMFIGPLPLSDSASALVLKKDSLGRKSDSTFAQKVKAGAEKVTKVANEERKKVSQDMPEFSDFFSFWKIFWAIMFLVAGYFIIRFITYILEMFAEKSTRHRITIKGLVPVVGIFGWFTILIFIVVAIFQPPAEAVWAVTASAGIAIGFAAQDILKNVFGGIMIIFDRPFQVGDKIEVGSYYGEVTEIGLRSTRIVTADDSLVSVPNSEVMNQSVSNSNTGEPNCQVVAEIWLPLGIDTGRARQIATESAQVSSYIYLNKPIAVLFFNEVKERRSYLKMRLKAYVMDIRYEFAFKSEMTETVVRELIRQGVLDPEEMK